MKLLWTVLAIPLLWAQEESRARSEAPASPRPTTRAVQPRPAPKEEVIIMETLSGRVIDKQGTDPANIRLWFVDKSTGKVLGETRTDAQGNFALVLPTAVETVIVRMSREGKSFTEKEYSLSELLRSEPEFVFEP